MTSLRKSDAQLDAEASGREMSRSASAAAGSATPVGTSPEPLEERDLDAAILLHRALHRTEVWIPRLHQSTGMTTDHNATPNLKETAKGHIGWTGMEFSQAFIRYLDGEYGSLFPYAKAMQSLRQNCRVTHRPKHTDRPEWRGSLCAELVALVVRLDYSLDIARLKLGLPEEGKTRRTLDNALLYLERRLEDSYWREQQGKPLERSPAEWMAAAHNHHAVLGLHEVDCIQCLKRRAA